MTVAQAHPARPNKDNAAAKTIAKEPVWVFESAPYAPDVRAAEEVAIQCHRAAQEGRNGPRGSSYAIVTRGENNELLGFDQLQRSVSAFLELARSRPELDFRIAASPYRKSEEQFKKFAELFRNAPTNCELPGRWLESMGKLDSTRVIITDANIKAADTAARKRSLDQYFSANRALWTSGSIEIISLGLAHTIAQNDAFAKSRGYRHRVIALNPKRYGKYETLARQILSISYATKLVCFSDPMGTSTGFQMIILQYAAAAAVPFDEVLMNEA